MDVTVKEGENLRLGICSGCMKADGTQAPSSDPAGWFKVDHFRIERIGDEATAIKAIDHSPLTIDHSPLTLDGSVYNLAGVPISHDYCGIVVKKGRKILKY